MNKKLIFRFGAIALVLILGIIFGGKYIINKKLSPILNNKEKNLIFDAKKLQGASKEEVDKLLNTKGEATDLYKNYPYDGSIYSYGDNDLIYLNNESTCIYLSLSSWLKDKEIERNDDYSIIKKFGIDLEGSQCDNHENKRIYSKIKDFNGEVFLFLDNNEVDKIEFYPNGAKEAKEFDKSIKLRNYESHDINT